MTPPTSSRTTRTRAARHVDPSDDAAASPLTSPLSRRTMLAAGAVGAGALMLGASSARASSPGVTSQPDVKTLDAPVAPSTPLAPAGVDDSVPVLSDADRQFMTRFSWGLNEALVAEVTAAGGAQPWFETQLNPTAIPDPVGDDLDTWWPHLWWTPAKLGAMDLSGEMPSHTVVDDFVRLTLLRRMYSSRQLHEIMCDFWSNLLHVPAPQPKAFPHRMMYDKMIRANALTSFAKLLDAAVLHPAMGCYLDNARSTNTAPNENLGRELLELHTLGRDTGYTEDDVKGSMYILTGWMVDINKTWAPYYSLTNHWVGPVQVLDFTDANGSKDGQAVAHRYLSYLAHHELTAKRLAHRLAVRFSGEEPSDALVDAVAQAYLDSDTDIKATLHALVAHPDFLAGPQRVRTPVEDFVNTYRAMQLVVKKPTGHTSDTVAAIVAQCNIMGQRPFDWPRPDGFPDTDDSWASAGRVLGTFSVHFEVARGKRPTQFGTYKALDSWLPTLPERFDVVVDHMSRRILSRPSTPALLAAAIASVDVDADEVVERTSALVLRRLDALIQSLLDNPLHMSR